MEIYIRTQSSKTIKMTIDPFDSVKSIKDRIMERDGILPKTQTLIFDRKEIYDNQTMTDCKIQDKSTLHLIVTRC